MQIIRSLTKNSINRQQQILLQHSLDDIFRRTYHIKILMTAFNFGKHDFIDIECLIYNTDILTRLLFIPFGKFGKHIFIDIICPIIYLQHIFARFARIVASCERKQPAGTCHYPFIHLYLHLLMPLFSYSNGG